ncbi:MAG: hypothetical protein ACI9K2_003978, partial [Myxococcota bacterium]
GTCEGMVGSNSSTGGGAQTLARHIGRGGHCRTPWGGLVQE